MEKVSTLYQSCLVRACCCWNQKYSNNELYFFPQPNTTLPNFPSQFVILSMTMRILSCRLIKWHRRTLVCQPVAWVWWARGRSVFGVNKRTLSHPRARIVPRRRWDGHSRPMPRFPGRTADVAANLTSPVLGRPLCANGTPWILYLFEECVDNVWEYWSVVIGLISMFCFLLSTLP